MQTSPPPHRLGGNKRQPQGRRKTPQSTARAENHSHLLPTHLFVARRRFAERNCKKNIYFPMLWVSLHVLPAFALEKEREGGGRFPLKRTP
ncbi:hypothetical protein CEXT_15641 [Caerostris extrusa]|uniref:Uncharacterized protein n=1 Tax=Caerostris extrusa TaxID=172846 RepID=A0AAV4MEK2_CAEEX|nr:hypothetical protein CEXT_15641 [Caerostris extrusa]